MKELEELFDDFLLPNAAGAYSSMNIYPQNLPAKRTEDDDEHFPYILVRIGSGGTPSEDDPALCKVTLIVGVYDESKQYQGYKDVLGILRRMETHFFRKREIAGQFEIRYPFDWALHEEDVYPYYFGAAETNWTLPAVLHEVNYEEDE